MIRADPPDGWKLINFRVVDSLLAAEMLHELYGRHRPSINAVRFRNTLMTVQHGIVHAYAPQAEWNQLERWFGDRFLSASSELRAELRGYCAREFRRTPQLVAGARAAIKASPNDLARALIDLHYGAMGELYEVNLVQVEHALVSAVRTQLREAGYEGAELDRVAATLSHFEEPTAAGRERNEFGAIVAMFLTCNSPAQDAPEAAPVAAALQAHAERWGNLRNAYGYNEGGKAADLWVRLCSEALRPAGAHPIYASGPRTHLNGHPLLHDNAELLRLVGALRDRQKAALGAVGATRVEILNNIAARGLAARDELDLYLLGEIGTLLAEGGRLPPAELERRRQLVVLRRTEGLLPHLPSGIDIDNRIDLASSTLRGRCASPGHVIGHAAIVRRAGDASKVTDGSILVAPGTDFDLIDAMQRASAIVTEEGGLLSHAAVIARELAIPCLIGVDGAAAFLRDGDVLALDAEAGTLTVVSRASHTASAVS